MPLQKLISVLQGPSHQPAKFRLILKASLRCHHTWCGGYSTSVYLHGSHLWPSHNCQFLISSQCFAPGPFSLWGPWKQRLCSEVSQISGTNPWSLLVTSSVQMILSSLLILGKKAPKFTRIFTNEGDPFGTRQILYLALLYYLSSFLGGILQVVSSRGKEEVFPIGYISSHTPLLLNPCSRGVNFWPQELCGFYAWSKMVTYCWV